MSTAANCFTREETSKINANTPKEPKRAAATKPNEEKTPVKENPASKINATIRLDPEVIPKIDGPANGFLKSVWSSQPEIPKHAPAKAAVQAAGILNAHKTGSFSINLFQKSVLVIFILPNLTST